MALTQLQEFKHSRALDSAILIISSHISDIVDVLKCISYMEASPLAMSSGLTGNIGSPEGQFALLVYTSLSENSILQVSRTE